MSRLCSIIIKMGMSWLALSDVSGGGRKIRRLKRHKPASPYAQLIATIYVAPCIEAQVEVGR